MGDSNAGIVEPVTFQVYTPADISAGRRPMRSLCVAHVEPKKASLGVRIGLVFVGLIVVLLTGAAVIAVSTDDADRPSSSRTVVMPSPLLLSEPEPPAAPLSVDDPISMTIDDDTIEFPANPPTDLPNVAASSRKPKPTSGALKGVAPPPNPYGK